MIRRDFYPLADLAQRWGCTVNDLLHLGLQCRAQICVDVYRKTSIADGWITRRRKGLHEGFSNDASTKDYTSKNPPGILELKLETLRLLVMPNAFPHQLHDALNVDRGLWEYKFRTPVTINAGDLCMLNEEVHRVAREVFAPGDASATTARRVKAATRQDDAIIDALKKRGIDPLTLIPPKGNKPWLLRVEIGNELDLGKDVVRKAFTRLRKEGRMSPAPATPR